MDHELQLKIQAYLDGALPPAEARDVANLLARDRQALALHTELRHTRQAMTGFEVGIELPESREFFWSKIEREIQRLEPATPLARPSLVLRLRRWLVPASAMALVALVLSLALSRTAGGAEQVGEMELISPDMTAQTFRSQSERMTFVWLAHRDDGQGEVLPE